MYSWIFILENVPLRIPALTFGNLAYTTSNHMQHYIFVKKSPSVQLGHLYEHAIYMSLVDLLSSKKLYEYVDYVLIAKTYHGGLIYLELQAHTKAAGISSRLLHNIDLTLDETRFEVIRSQVSAELSQEIKIKDIHKTIEQIQRLHAQKWQLLDEFTELDATTDEAVDTKSQIFSGKPIKTTKLKVSVHNSNKVKLDRNLYPLIRQVSKLLAENLTQTFCDTYGLFNNGDEFIISEERIELETTLLASYPTIDLKDGYEEVTKQLIEAMFRDGAFNRFAKQLRSMSYNKNPLETVNFEGTYETTLIFIGSRGWKKIATDKNIMEVLDHLSIEITFKTHTIMLPVVHL